MLRFGAVSSQFRWVLKQFDSVPSIRFQSTKTENNFNVKPDLPAKSRKIENKEDEHRSPYSFTWLSRSLTYMSGNLWDVFCDTTRLDFGQEGRFTFQNPEAFQNHSWNQQDCHGLVLFGSVSVRFVPIRSGSSSLWFRFNSTSDSPF